MIEWKQVNGGYNWYISDSPIDGIKPKEYMKVDDLIDLQTAISVNDIAAEKVILAKRVV